MTRFLALAAIVLITEACNNRGDNTAPAATATSVLAAAPNRITLRSGDTLEVANRVAILRDRGGARLADNTYVIRGPGKLCPADGFRSVEPAGEGFRIRNQHCSGWFIVDEVMTFTRSGSDYVLTRFSAAYLDRRTNEPDGAPKVLTEAELGHRPFKDVNPDDLYPLFP